MTLTDLLKSLREEILDDAVAPYLWSDATLTRYLNNAVEEACIRARLMHVDAVSDPERCNLTVAPNASGRLAYDSSIIMIRSASLSDAHHKLHAVASTDMDKRHPGWDAGTKRFGTPEYMVLDIQQKVFQLWPIPQDTITLQLRAWRVPLVTELMSADVAEPAIVIPRSEDLRLWAAHEAFLKRDADTSDPQASSNYLALFESRFGPRPTFHEMTRWADSPPRIRSSVMF